MTTAAEAPEDVRLNEMGKTEWRDIAQRLRPDLFDEEYDRMWSEFENFKLSKSLHWPFTHLDINSHDSS